MQITLNNCTLSKVDTNTIIVGLLKYIYIHIFSLFVEKKIRKEQNKIIEFIEE